MSTDDLCKEKKYYKESIFHSISIWRWYNSEWNISSLRILSSFKVIFCKRWPNLNSPRLHWRFEKKPLSCWIVIDALQCNCSSKSLHINFIIALNVIIILSSQLYINQYLINDQNWSTIFTSLSNVQSPDPSLSPFWDSFCQTCIDIMREEIVYCGLVYLFYVFALFWKAYLNFI